MAIAKNIKYGHWTSLCGEIDSSQYFGFVYMVYCHETHRFYIGKKQFNSVSRKTVAGKKRKQVTVKESDWMKYQTSSQYVKEDIEKFGTDKFDFWILQAYKTKSGLSYAESNLMHKQDVMYRMLDSKYRLFYNANIAAVRFVTKEFYEEPNKLITKLIKQRG
ncbi:GIY-YIG homing endonuclease [Yersinia phage vB_YenM_P778]